MYLAHRKAARRFVSVMALQSSAVVLLRTQVALDARVVHQHVNAPEDLTGARDGRTDLRFVADVGLDEQHVTALGTERRFELSAAHAIADRR